MTLLARLRRWWWELDLPDDERHELGEQRELDRAHAEEIARVLRAMRRAASRPPREPTVREASRHERRRQATEVYATTAEGMRIGRNLLEPDDGDGWPVDIPIRIRPIGVPYTPD